MDRGAWWATVHGVAKSWTRLNDNNSKKKSIFKEYFCLIVFEAFTDPLKIPRSLLFIFIYLVWTTKKNVSELHQTLKSSESYSFQKTKDKCVFFFLINWGFLSSILL